MLSQRDLDLLLVAAALGRRAEPGSLERLLSDQAAAQQAAFAPAIALAIALARTLVCSLDVTNFWHREAATAPARPHLGISADAAPDPAHEPAHEPADEEWDIYAVHLAGRGCAVRVSIYEYQDMPKLVLAELQALQEPACTRARWIWP